MKNELLKIVGVASLIVLQGAFRIDASTVVLSEAAGTVELYLANGTQVSTTYSSPTAGAVIGNYSATRFGTFINGFTPNTGNSASWFSNFVGVNGYLGVLNASSNAGKLSDSITSGDGNAITSSVAGNTGVNSTTLVLPSGSKLYAIFWNAPYVSNTSGGNTFYPGTSSNGAQAAILTNPDWIMPLTAGNGSDITTFSLTTGTTALLGALDLANKGITMTLIPEPSSVSLLALGVAGLVALRIRRKS
jgi:hypothetical protein